MKRNRLHIAIATAVALGCTLTACTQDNDTAVTDGEHRTPIAFNVNIGGLPAPEVSTRGYTTGKDHNSGYTFTGHEVVSIGITGKGVTSRSELEDVKQYKVTNTTTGGMTYNGTPQTDAFDWLSQSEHIDVRAWSYGNGDTPSDDPNGRAFTISSTQNTDTDIKELLYMPTTDIGFGNVEINLYHQLARVVVSITATLPSDVSVTSVNIGNNNIPTSGTFAIPTSTNYGSWSSQTGFGTINARRIAETPGTTHLYSAVVIPYNGNPEEGTPGYYAKETRFITIVTTRGTYYYNIPSTINETDVKGLNLQAGHQYTFTITNLNQIDLNVTVTAWSNDNDNGETVTFS